MISTTTTSSSVTPCLTTLNSGSTIASPKKAKKTCQLRAKKWFLTFPQCSLPRQEVLKNLSEKFPPVEWYVISSEKHKDGSPHLHLALSFEKEFSSRDMRVFDPLCGQHGDYKPMKNQLKCIQYVTKEGEYDSHGIDVKAVMQKKNGKFEDVAKLIAEGQTMKELFVTHPGFVLNHKRKIEDLQQWMKRNKKEEKKEWVKFKTEDIRDLNTPSEISIAEWLNKNIKEKRDFKQTQLYIWGPPNMGKTSLINKLSEFLRIYYVPRDEDFYDEYEDGVYDLIVFDEFTNTKKMQFMNQFLDGQSMYLRKKGGQIMKSDNLPIIILSNYSLEQNYKKLYEAAKLGPICARLEVVEVKEFISLWP